MAIFRVITGVRSVFDNINFRFLTSICKVPAQIGMTLEVANPALPPRKKSKILPSRYRPPPKSVVTNTRGVGANRVYLDIQSRPPDVAYPPRPVPGSIADLDVIMELCDFSLNRVCFSSLVHPDNETNLFISMYGIVLRLSGLAAA